MSKTAKAIELFQSGEQEKALRIFRTFKIGFTKEEKRTLEIAQESMSGNESFYKSIQLDTATIRQQAIQLIKSKYNL